MKIRLVNRILQFIGGLILIALGVIGVPFVSNALRYETFSVNSLFAKPMDWSPAFVASAVVLLLLGLLLVFFAFRMKRGRYYVVQTNDSGNVQISVQAIDHLIRKCLQHYGDITLSNVHIGGQDEAVVVRLRMVIRSDVRIPKLVAEIRGNVKEYIESCSGVKVERVEVIVDATKDAAGRQDAGHAAESRNTPLLPSAEPMSAPAEDSVGAHVHAWDDRASKPAEPAVLDERDPIYLSHTGTQEAPATQENPITAGEADFVAEDGVPDELVSLDAMEQEVEDVDGRDDGHAMEEEPDAE